jgi:hypothetical protein
LPVHLNKFVRLDRLEIGAARFDPRGLAVDASAGIPFADNDILTRLIAQYDPRGRTWARPLLAEMGIPHRFLPDIVPPATDLGPLLPPLAHLPGLGGSCAIATACHDTQAAITAVPARDPNYAYISSGSWSLMGVEVREPIIDDRTLRYNFTNEGGVGGFCLLKNLTGLRLVQECRRAWSRPGQEVSYANLMTLAAKASSFGALIDPDSPLFLNPDDMPAAIAQFCAQTGQTPPATPGATIRGALEGLASGIVTLSTNSNPSWASELRLSILWEGARPTRSYARWLRTPARVRFSPARSKRPRWGIFSCRCLPKDRCNP